MTFRINLLTIQEKYLKDAIIIIFNLWLTVVVTVK